MPCENIHDDLPTYQQSALTRFLADRLLSRARARREAAAAETVRRPIRVQATASTPQPDERATPAAGQRALAHEPIDPDALCDIAGQTDQLGRERRPSAS